MNQRVDTNPLDLGTGFNDGLATCSPQSVMEPPVNSKLNQMVSRYWVLIRDFLKHCVGIVL